MKILVVEDEPKTAACLQLGLGDNGFASDVTGDGAEGLYLATTGAYDLILLDVLLPHCDGWTILAALRRAGRRTPVIFLTACDTVPEWARGLELEADDFLVKPFAFSALMGRVRALLRQGEPTRCDALRIADLRIDLARREVERGGRGIELDPRQFDLLALLASRSGELVSHQAIAREVWGMSLEGDTDVVDTAVRRLVAKVDDPFEKKLIHRVRGVGYVVEER